VNNATERSLVILDEIGRGTSTFDGLSIAWSVAEFLHDKIKARTLFATHYHELTKLAAERKGVCNFNVAVREWNEQIIFLRRSWRAAPTKVMGSRWRGWPVCQKKILDRAKEILRTWKTRRRRRARKEKATIDQEHAAIGEAAAGFVIMRDPSTKLGMTEDGR